MIEFPDELYQRDTLEKCLNEYPHPAHVEEHDRNGISNIIYLWDKGFIKVTDFHGEEFRRFDIIRYIKQCEDDARLVGLSLLITPCGINSLNK